MWQVDHVKASDVTRGNQCTKALMVSKSDRSEQEGQLF